jgi:hypothetical protein
VPNRILRDGILTSYRINKLGGEAELFYRRLISAVDDFGRYLGSPTALRVATFPLKISQFTDEQVAVWIADCERAELVEIYSVEGVEYVEIKEFGQRLREGAKSKYPAPPQVRGESAADPPPFRGSRAQAPTTSTPTTEVLSRKSGSEISEVGTDPANRAFLPRGYSFDEQYTEFRQACVDFGMNVIESDFTGVAWSKWQGLDADERTAAIRGIKDRHAAGMNPDLDVKRPPGYLSGKEWTRAIRKKTTATAAYSPAKPYNPEDDYREADEDERRRATQRGTISA